MKYDTDLPDFLATVWDANAIITKVIDRLTREPIEGHNIVFADAKSGYFVAWRGPIENSEYYIVQNQDFVIRRYINKDQIEYWDSDEMEFEN